MQGEAKIMKIKIGGMINLKALLYYPAIIFYCAQYYIGASLLDYKLPKTLTLLLQMLVLGFLFMKWVLTEKYTLKKIIWILMILASSAVVAYSGKYISLFLFICLMVSASGVPFEKIVKLLEINVWFWMVAIILLCKAGMLQDYTYYHTIGIGGIAHSWGFKYYSWLGYTSMALTMMWIYRHKKIKLWHCIVIMALNYAFYKVHTTNLSLVLTAGFVFACYCTEGLQIIKLKSRFWGVVAAITPIGLYVATWSLVIMYKVGKIFISMPILKTIVNRMRYSSQALDLYGLHLFGTHVTQIGNVDIYYKNVSKTGAIYIDSGFIYSTIAYGLIFTVLLLVIYTWLGIYLYKTNNRILFIWFMVMMGACCVNNFMCDIINNPILMILPSAILSKTPAGGLEQEKRIEIPERRRRRRVKLRLHMGR